MNDPPAALGHLFNMLIEAREFVSQRLEHGDFRRRVGTRLR
jgi:hypothetical protein